jgi:intein-encoded DNA endonuclease-like protein
VVSRRRTTNRVISTLEERIDRYQKTIALNREGLHRGGIVREMLALYNIPIDFSQVIDWTERGVSPYGRVHRFEPAPTPELAYLCGVKLGDASLSKGTWQHTYKFRLLVVDKEFVQEFSRCASIVLHCEPFRVWWYEKRRMWCTEVCSILLYRFLREGLPRFRELAGPLFQLRGRLHPWFL